MPGRRRVAASVAARGVAALLGILLAIVIVGAGCELIVPSSVTSFKCSGDSPGACPAGQVCASGPGQCIPASQACSKTGCTPPQSCDPASLQCVTSPSSDGSNPFGNDSSDEASDTAAPPDSPVPP